MVKYSFKAIKEKDVNLQDFTNRKHSLNEIYRLKLQLGGS